MFSNSSEIQIQYAYYHQIILDLLDKSIIFLHLTQFTI